MKFASLESRLKDLEQIGGYVTLPDGSRFRPSNAIVLYVDYMKLPHDHGAPVLSDFPSETQEEWQCFARWEPDAEAYGAISVAVAEMARDLVERS
jgi:hypothetical protein